MGLWGLAIMLAGALALAIIAAAPFAWAQYTATEYSVLQKEVTLIESKLTGAKTVGGPKVPQGTDVSPMFVGGKTDGTVLAELQRIVAVKAGDSGAQIMRLQPLQSDADGQATMVRLEVAAGGTLAQLQGFILSLETQLPVLFVVDAQMTPKQQSDQEFPSEAMMLVLKLEAFSWREASTP
jgi:hypothetical protein